MYTKKLTIKQIAFAAFSIFIVWRIILFLPQIFPLQSLKLQQHFLGGGRQHFIANPLLWSWANFDGEHYLAIARSGYHPLEYFFFPLYPFLLSKLSISSNYVFSGLVISHISMFLAIFGLWRLLSLDYPSSTVFRTILLILAFPTSFYFVGVYTESLFLALCVWSFYFARRRSFLLASILGAGASATRLVGVILLPALFAESLIQKNKRNVIFLFIVPLGLILYMLYLYKTVGDPLAFFHSIEVFGEQRSTNLVLLPQVFYRYFFKILPSVNYSYFPIVFTTYLEIAVGVLALILSLIAFKKIRLSYALFALIGYLIPTLSGSFSSLPRYVIILFPLFLIAAIISERLPKVIFYAIVLMLYLALFYAESLFIKGYWVA